MHHPFHDRRVITYTKISISGKMRPPRLRRIHIRFKCLQTIGFYFTPLCVCVCMRVFVYKCVCRGLLFARIVSFFLRHVCVVCACNFAVISINRLNIQFSECTVSSIWLMVGHCVPYGFRRHLWVHLCRHTNGQMNKFMR